MDDSKYQAILPQIENASKLLGLLSKRDTFLILLMLEDGLHMDSRRFELYGLSREQCKRRLRKLEEWGLIQRNSGMYTYTKFGNHVSQSLLKYLSACNKSIAVLDWLEKLKDSEAFSSEEIEELQNILMGIRSTPDASSIRFVWSYEESLSVLVHMIQQAKKELFIATRIMHESLVKSVLNRARAGVNIRVLVDQRLAMSYVNNLSHLLKDESDRHSSERRATIIDPFYPEKIPRRISEVPFGLVVIDRKEAALEIINQHHPEEMHGGLHLRAENCSEMLAEFFENLWDQAVEPTAEMISSISRE